jgi:hypothetical protein
MSYQRKKLRYPRDIFTDYGLSMIRLTLTYPQASALYTRENRPRDPDQGTYA